MFIWTKFITPCIPKLCITFKLLLMKISQLCRFQEGSAPFVRFTYNVAGALSGYLGYWLSAYDTEQLILIKDIYCVCRSSIEKSLWGYFAPKIKKRGWKSRLSNDYGIIIVTATSWSEFRIGIWGGVGWRDKTPGFFVVRVATGPPFPKQIMIFILFYFLNIFYFFVDRAVSFDTILCVSTSAQYKSF